MKTHWKVLLIIAGFLLGIQIFLVDKDFENVPIDNDYIVYNKMPQEVAVILKNACYDCHSYQTRYPWYANVAPTSWVIANNIHNGRAAMNFSKWKQYYTIDAFKLEQKSAIAVEVKKMPIPSYYWFGDRPEMTDAERALLVHWFVFYVVMPDTANSK